MRAYRYRIEVAGALGPLLREAFADFEITGVPGATALVAELDQAGLFSVLHRIESLSLELKSVSRTEVAVPV